ncbi:uncharacterized protein LOC136069182 [Quercus suber]|uniref:uncharacterized protein LOC136069182 n=1 Tax=Quercus suber TaxID=58331 RepID=UPI0032DF4256
MSVARLPVGDLSHSPKRAKSNIKLVLGFSDEDKVGTIQLHDDTLVITLRIGGYDVKRVMADQGSVVEIMYSNLYKGLNLKPDDLAPYNSHLVSFEGRVVTSKGQIRLPVQIGAEVVEVDFIVVDIYSPYTAIVARPRLHTQRLFPLLYIRKLRSTYQRMMTRMFEAQLGRSIEIYIDDMVVKSKIVSKHVKDLEKIFEVLRKYKVDPEFICHHLKVNPLITPKKQPPRCPSKEHANAVREEVTKLKQAGAIKEVFYPEWLANTVVMKKKNGKW